FLFGSVSRATFPVLAIWYSAWPSTNLSFVTHSSLGLFPRSFTVVPRTPGVPWGILTWYAGVACEPVRNRKAQRVACKTTLPEEPVGSYTNLSSRTSDVGPTLRLVLSRNTRSAMPRFPVRTVWFAEISLPAESVCVFPPATAPHWAL